MDMTTLRGKKISRCVWCAKAVAILTVIIAHSDFQNVRPSWLVILFQRIGSMGVPVFLLLSAYYYRPTKYASLQELLNSRKTTFFPWIILAGACYLWSYLRMGKEINVQSCLQFVLGYNSLFYFLSVLILLQVLFYFFRYVSIRKMAGICIVLSIISTELAAFGITDDIISKAGLTNYLNIFNWVGFFSIGLYLQTKEDSWIIGYIKKYFGWAILIWGTLFALSGYVEHGQYGYFSILGIFMESASAILILRFAWSICRYDWIVQLGKYSFAIYLVHINIVPIVNKFLGGNAFGEIASPFCTYIISFLLILCACMLLKKMKMSHLTKYLLGVRME